MIELDKTYRHAAAREFLPLVRGPAKIDGSGLGALLQYPASVDTIPQPPPLCFENHWQPQFSAKMCEVPLQVKTLYLPVVSGARLFGKGIVIAKNDMILAESIGRHADRLGLEVAGDSTSSLSAKLKLAVHRAKKRPISRHDCTGLLLFDPAIRHFGMWMLKCLPKLGVLPLLAEPEARVVVPTNVPDLYLAMLEHLGVSANQIIFHDAGGISVFRKLVIPPKMYTFTSARSTNPFQIFCHESRPGHTASSRLLVSTHAQKRIYISRRKTRRRRLANELAVERLFEEFGFQIVEPSLLTAVERVSMFANCKFIAGAQGSGLYNVVFSRRKPKALQLVPPELKFENAFLIMGHLCNGKGGNAGHVFGRIQEDLRGQAGEFDYSWEVDLERLRYVLALLVG